MQVQSQPTAAWPDIHRCMRAVGVLKRQTFQYYLITLIYGPRCPELIDKVR